MSDIGYYKCPECEQVIEGECVADDTLPVRIKLHKNSHKTTEGKLLLLCQRFRDTHKISTPEAIHQMDDIIQDAYQFIEDACDIIGYYEYKDDED